MTSEVVAIVRWGGDQTALNDVDAVGQWVANDPYGSETISAQRDIAEHRSGVVIWPPVVEDVDGLYAMLRAFVLATGAQATAVELAEDGKRLVEFGRPSVLSWYLAHPGNCPCCHAPEIEGMDWDDEFHSQRIRCLVCHRDWVDVYELKDAEFAVSRT